MELKEVFEIGEFNYISDKELIIRGRCFGEFSVGDVLFIREKSKDKVHELTVEVITMYRRPISFIDTGMTGEITLKYNCCRIQNFEMFLYTVED